MIDTAVASVIVRHIDELELAFRYADQSMEPMLSRAVAQTMDEKRKAYGWTGKVPEDLKRVCGSLQRSGGQREILTKITTCF